VALPDWLQAHVGEGEGQIAPVVLQRARALYLKKVSEGAINNPCYFGLGRHAPRRLGTRFYVICEADRRFARSPPAMATAATLKASRTLQTTFAAQRTSAMRWIPTYDRRAICDGRNQNVVQRLLSHLGGRKAWP
jgi:hypothetical protein